jgi:AraC family transcriptional regulator
MASLRLAAGQFFGGARLSCSGRGIDVSHRIAEAAPEQVLTHTHEDAHFILVTGGDYVSIAEGRRAAGRPVLVYNPPGTTHRDHFERGRGSFFAISLQPATAASALAEGTTPTGPLHLVAPVQHTLAMRIGGFCAQRGGDLSLEALCFELVGSMDQRAQVESRSPPGWLGLALELLHDCYAEELTVADIARSVGVHPIYLARSFRRHFRCTPGEFARFRRLEKAVTLLIRTSLPLADVALSSGFADQSHFTKTFARCFGVPPGEYRILAGGDAGVAHRFRIDKTHASHWAKVTAWAAAARSTARKHR